MSPTAAKRLRFLFSAVTLLVLLAGAAGFWLHHRVKRSLPQLEGTAALSGLSAAVVVERDAAGVPTIRAQSQADAARALGFLHAQDRFFQMDLSRRRAAGELAALVGAAAVEMDKRVRVHGFRRLAQAVLSQLPEHQRAVLDAYAGGANAGLRSLRDKPFEYLLLRSDPEPWLPEDCVLLIYAMTLDLQDDRGGYEQSLAAVRDVLGPQALAYFAPLVGPGDAALDESTETLPSMPGPRRINLRPKEESVVPSPALSRLGDDDDTVLPGSNGFALSAERTANGGGALLASDMHLSLRLPNVWYRAVLIHPDPATNETVRLVGVTLPGAPALIVGSNGHVAWGFTNANADVSDLAIIDVSTLDPLVYADREGLLTMEKREEVIAVKGEDPVTVYYDWTVHGPVVGRNAARKSLALRWTMHDPAAANYGLLDMASARTVEEAVAVAHRSGIPVQNIVIAAKDGRIAWTICGFLPKRIGFDGRLPVSWTFGDRRWEGFLPAEAVPTVISPASGQLWTANQRILGGPALAVLGDGGYDRAPRASRIRDLLTPLRDAVPRDLLAVQLDTGARHLDRWHQLLTAVLTDDAITQSRTRARLREALLPWKAAAEADSVSYRLVRRFRHHVVRLALPPLFERCAEVHPFFSYRRFHYEPALWQMLEEKPEHLLGADHASWDALLLAAVDAVQKELDDANLAVESATWGRFNTSAIRHPFAGIFKPLASWLSLPPVPLPGDYDTPRVQAPDDGASERLVVSPGREEQGLFHMPGGQSGHPLSPYFSAGHEAWIQGEPTPLLPGPTRHTLRLEPQQGGGGTR